MNEHSCTHVKICCIKNIAEAEFAIAAGTYALGLVSKMPSGPGVIPETRIAEITAQIPDHITSILLTSEVRADAIIAQHQKCRTTALQLVDMLPMRELQELKLNLPSVDLVQVIHVTGPDVVDQTLAVEPYVDYILLDSGEPKARTRKLGGTGCVHDWNISAGIVESVSRPVFLAGGLTPDNVGEAIRRVRPYGVDVCSGVRSRGRLDPDKLLRFMGAVRQSSVEISNARHVS
jgi:phosphoribosylanthranilate isomerase